MKFDVEYPCKFPYFSLQMWDQDIFSYSDCLAQGGLNLGPHFREAYKQNRRYHVFEDLTDKSVRQRSEAVHAESTARIDEAERQDREAALKRSSESANAVAGRPGHAGPAAAGALRGDKLDPASKQLASSQQRGGAVESKDAFSMDDDDAAARRNARAFTGKDLYQSKQHADGLTAVVGGSTKAVVQGVATVGQMSF